MMTEIGAFEAKSRLGQLLDRVEAGEEIVITRRGRPVACLEPASFAFDRQRAQTAADGIRAMRKGVTLGDISVRALIEDGRK